MQVTVNEIRKLHSFYIRFLASLKLRHASNRVSMLSYIYKSLKCHINYNSVKLSDKFHYSTAAKLEIPAQWLFSKY